MSFESLSSSKPYDIQSIASNVALPDKNGNLALRKHVEDTIDRLHGHAKQIERAGAKHRRQRVEAYGKKEDPKWRYNAFKQIATRKADDEFKLASDTIKQRIAESFARRRIRFEYLKVHQKKRAVDTGSVLGGTLAPKPRLEIDDGLTPLAKEKETAKRDHHLDQPTIYSATENTKLDLHPEPGQQERVESVASVALRHHEFPPPPNASGGSFQCPYCRLEFRALEAEKNRWG